MRKMIPTSKPCNSENSAFKAFSPKRKTNTPPIPILRTDSSQNQIVTLNKRKIETIKSEEQPFKKTSSLLNSINPLLQFLPKASTGGLIPTQCLPHFYVLPNTATTFPPYINSQTQPKIKTGFTTYPLADGIYTGNIVNGIFQGKGTVIWTDGEKYEGEFAKDTFHGKGTYFMSNGAKYEGDFVYHEYHGKGRYLLTNGDIYEGEFANNHYHGKGTFVSKNGAKYEGDFVNGLRHGKGIESDKDDNTSAVDYVNGIKK